VERIISIKVLLGLAILISIPLRVLLWSIKFFDRLCLLRVQIMLNLKSVDGKMTNILLDNYNTRMYSPLYTCVSASARLTASINELVNIIFEYSRGIELRELNELVEIHEYRPH